MLKHKKTLFLICMILITVLTVGSTLALIIVKTPAILNIFLPDEPTGDVIISKTVHHPFGQDYTIPADMEFTFRLALGIDQAGKEIETTAGKKIADANGDLLVSVKPGLSVGVMGLPTGKEITVTEVNIPAGFTPEGGADKTVTVPKRADTTLAYTNTYAPAKAPVILTLTGNKELEGRQWQEGDSFTFSLEVKKDGWQELGTRTITYEPENPDFNKFDFTQLLQDYPFDQAGVHSFRISEKSGTIGGITYDATVSYIDVTVTDTDMDGTLEISNVKASQNASVTTENGIHNIQVDIRNVYAPEGSAQVLIKLQKTLNDLSGADQAPEGFTFQVLDKDGKVVATSEPTAAAGEAVIKLVYEAIDAGRTFDYTVVETKGDRAGMTYDDTAYKVRVDVIDNLDGTIRAEAYDPEDDTANAANQAAAVILQGTQAPTEPEQAESTVDTEATEATTEAATQTSEATGETTEAATQTSEPETEPSEPVTEPERQVIWSDTHILGFANTYDPANTTCQIAGTKKLTGRTMAAEEFTFCLHPTGDGFQIPDGQIPYYAKNLADGTFKFVSIEYNKVGVYRYVVTESSAEPLGGITYDKTAYQVTVTVTDVGGSLQAEQTITDVYGQECQIVFNNIYKTSDALFDLIAKKTITGKVLKDREFRFLLYEADESFKPNELPYRKGVNDLEGKIQFEQFKFEQPGVHYFVLREDDADQLAGVTYDKTIFGIKLTVYDDGLGKLQVKQELFERTEVEEEGKTLVKWEPVEEMVFENTYVKPPEEPATGPTEGTGEQPTEPGRTPTEPPTPPTGDESDPGLFLGLLVCSAIALIATLVGMLLGKKKKK